MTVALIKPDVLYAWKGPSLLIVDGRGECADDQPISGFYYREARYLRSLSLTINGRPPWLCEAASLAPDVLEFSYVHPEISAPGGGGTGQAGDEEAIDAHGVPERAIDLRIRFRVGIAALDVDVTFTNRALIPVRLELAWLLGADFADIQEANAGRREQTADVDASRDNGGLEFHYLHPHLPFRTAVRADAGWEVRGSRLVSNVTLASQQSNTSTLRVVPSTADGDLAADDVAAREKALERWCDSFTSIDVPGNRIAERIVRGSIRDFASFAMLTGAPDEWLALQAGMPLYPAFFGRDAMTAGWQAGLVDRGQALQSGLVKLARLQSDRVDDWRDEEPGRIPYQVRTGPLALLNLNPYSAYYADYASPLMFVISLANLYAWTGNRDYVRQHWDTARRILDWAREYGDSDRDGYLEYQTRSSKGTKNQGWKDSGDAIIYDDGRPVPSPIATCELQGYWYVAQELMALLCDVMQAPDDAREYRRSAAALKSRFNRDWWIDEERFFALALDPDKRQVRAPTSNVGHCLACGIIERERLPATVGRLFAPDMFSGWGVRTLSSDHRFYNPISYHRGSVWAVEQGTIVFGLRRFGFDARALELTRALFDLAELYPDDRIPETIGGYDRGTSPVPGAYPRANTPQLWNATAFPLAVQSILGLLPLAPIDTLVIDPVLPAWMPEIVLRDLRVGEAAVSLRFWRGDDGGSRWEVLHKRGRLRVVDQPPPESLTASIGDRVTALVQTLRSA